MDMTALLRLPGFGGGGSSSPAPLQPLPTREDPSIAEAKEKLRLSEKRRKGRRASILTGSSGVEDDTLGVTRPEAGNGGRQSKLTLG